jgi:hypothetical protein
MATSKKKRSPDPGGTLNDWPAEVPITANDGSSGKSPGGLEGATLLEA